MILKASELREMVPVVTPVALSDDDRDMLGRVLRGAAANGQTGVRISPPMREPPWSPHRWADLVADELRAAGYTVEIPAYPRSEPAIVLVVSWGER